MKKNATVVVCPKNYLFCIPTNFLLQLFDTFTQIYLPYLGHFAPLVFRSWIHELIYGLSTHYITSLNLKVIPSSDLRMLCQYQIVLPLFRALLRHLLGPDFQALIFRRQVSLFCTTTFKAGYRPCNSSLFIEYENNPLQNGESQCKSSSI